jgi:hypothetical protein
MIYIFNEYYKACSNIFITTIEEYRYTYPSPLNLVISMDTEENKQQSYLEIKVTSYSDSFLTLDKNFSFYVFLLNHEYIIKTLYIGNLTKDTVNQEVGGYKGKYRFTTDTVAMNIGLTDIYDKYVKVKEQTIKEEIIID